MPEKILEVVVGSTVHGTNVQDGLEDLDIMAVSLETRSEFIGFNTKDTWTFRTKPEGVRSEAGDVDFVSYGLKKFLSLALKGNPTVLVALFTTGDHIRYTTPDGDALRALAPHIASKEAYPRFRGYMKQQHERLLGMRGQKKCTRPELVEKYGYDTKYAGHIIRLGLQGEEYLLTGKITLPLEDCDRQLVVDVRNGKYDLHLISEMISEAEQTLDEACENSTLPEHPDRKHVEEWMIATYLKHWTQP